MLRDMAPIDGLQSRPVGAGQSGPGFENNVELKVFDSYRSRMNIFSGMRYFLDGRPHVTHVAGPQIASTGGLYAAGQGVNDSRGESGPSVDAVIADRIGPRTRFRSLEVCLTGTQKTWSRRSGSVINTSEGSPAALYARIFGPNFRDPNAADFTPDPALMARRSVLSLVAEQRKEFVRTLGASDRVRIDEYFTALRTSSSGSRLIWKNLIRLPHVCRRLKRKKICRDRWLKMRKKMRSSLAP